MDAATAMAEGIRQAIPEATVDCCPVGDGGEGTLSALLESVDGVLTTVEVSGPFGEDMDAEFGIFDNGKLAFVEAAKCIGLSLVPSDHRDPTKTTSFGVGELLLEAAATAKVIVIGLGGSATNDGGCGMAQALGYRFYDADDNMIIDPLCGGMLLQIARIDVSQRTSALQDIDIVVASDVNNPMSGENGASVVYAQQKGADANQVALLDQGLVHLAEIIRRDLNIDIENMVGAGAAGGLGGGLAAFAGAKVESGIDLVLKMIRFDDRVKDCAMCLTGEGRLDRQSNYGKACMGVANAAASHKVPAVALVGSVGDGSRECLDAGLENYILIGDGLAESESMLRAGELLSAAASAAVSKIA